MDIRPQDALRKLLLSRCQKGKLIIQVIGFKSWRVVALFCGTGARTKPQKDPDPDFTCRVNSQRPLSIHQQGQDKNVFPDPGIIAARIMPADASVWRQRVLDF